MRARGMTAIDRVGQKIGLLSIVSRVANRLEGKALRACWLCECDCGNRIVVSSHSLGKADKGKGGTRSCGCLAKIKPIKHGRCETKAYRSWHMMLQRCQNPKNPAFKGYGGRGIQVCKEWSDFQAFYADMGDPPDFRTLDRIDNSLGYFKSNCRWATKKEQGNNRRSNTYIIFRGDKKTLTQWAESTGLSIYCIRSRLNAGWSVDKMLTTPNQRNFSS